jgi:serine/threonine protein kinase HipA of HipAB toxin-antitoxin module
MPWLKVFGHLMGNTAMHLGNLSFNRVGSRSYALAPVYDMLPMLNRPASGETPLQWRLGTQPLIYWSEVNNQIKQFKTF